MTDRELMQMALDNLRWINDEQAIMSYATVKTLRERLSQPEPEPVAWLDTDGFPWSKEGVACRSVQDTYTPLYTYSPQREWVGLTDEDLSVCDEDGVILARYWEAKLKEKNGG